MRRGKLIFFFLASLISVNWAFLLVAPTATAASITSARNVMSTMAVGQASDHEIMFVSPSGMILTNTLILGFAANFNLSDIVGGDIDFHYGSTNNCSTSTFTLAPTSNLVRTRSGQNIIITFSNNAGLAAIPANRCLRIKVGLNTIAGSNQIKNPSTAGAYTISVSGTFGDTGSIAVNILSNGSVSIGGQVAPSIACNINNTSSSFGTFTSGTVATGSNTITWTISTNAANGYVLTVQNTGNGVSPGLYSPVVNYLIGSADNSFNANANLNTVSIGYGLQGSSTNGDTGSAPTTVAARYNQTANNVGGFGLAPIALASSTGPVSNATVVSTFKAKVSGLVPAGNYTDTVTYICTGIY